MGTVRWKLWLSRYRQRSRDVRSPRRAACSRNAHGRRGRAEHRRRRLRNMAIAVWPFEWVGRHHDAIGRAVLRHTKRGAAIPRGLSGAVPPPVNAAQHMQQLASITLGTLGGALGVAQQQASHFQYEDQEFAALEAKNAGVTGRLQAIQVSNEILLVQAQQLQLLRQLLITLINAESVYHGARLSTDVQAAAQASQFLSAGGTGQ